MNQNLNAMVKFRLLFLAMFFIAFNCMAQIPVDSLVAFYNFDGNAIDVSGNSNDGICNFVFYVNDRFGIPNAACLFDGWNSYIEIQFDNSLLVQTERSVSFWIFPNSWDGRAGVLCQAGTHGNQIFADFGNQLRWEMYHNSFPTNINSADSFIIEQEWQFITVVMTSDNAGSAVSYYRNAVFFSSDTAQTFIDPKTTNYYIGAERNLAWNYFFDGILDDMKVYNRALDLEEIHSLYSENGFVGAFNIPDITIDVFPIPTADLLNIRIDATNLMNGFDLKVFNTQGKLVMDAGTCPNEFQIDLSRYHKGLYLFKFCDKKSGNHLISKRIVLL